MAKVIKDVLLVAGICTFETDNDLLVGATATSIKASHTLICSKYQALFWSYIQLRWCFYLIWKLHLVLLATLHEITVTIELSLSE